MAGLVPAIHVFTALKFSKAWMPGTRLVLGPAKPDPSAGHDEDKKAAFEPPFFVCAYFFLSFSASFTAAPNASKSRLRGEVLRHTRPIFRDGSGEVKR